MYLCSGHSDEPERRSGVVSRKGPIRSAPHPLAKPVFDSLLQCHRPARGTLRNSDRPGDARRRHLSLLWWGANRATDEFGEQGARQHISFSVPLLAGDGIRPLETVHADIQRVAVRSRGIGETSEIELREEMLARRDGAACYSPFVSRRGSVTLRKEDRTAPDPPLPDNFTGIHRLFLLFPAESSCHCRFPCGSLVAAVTDRRLPRSVSMPLPRCQTVVGAVAYVALHRFACLE
jgi:hypothetical protein